MGGAGVWGKSNQTNFKGGKMSYDYKASDLLLMMIAGVAIGFIISMFSFFKGTDRDYYRLKDRCKGVIGIVEDGKGVELEFECVGGYETN